MKKKFQTSVYSRRPIASASAEATSAAERDLTSTLTYDADQQLVV